MLPLIASAATRELWAPDEPRYAQVSKEIYDTGQFLVMHLCESVYPSKPPLQFWLSGLCGWASGWSEFAMRLPSLASTLAMAWLTAKLARRLWGALEARLAPAIFLTIGLVLWHGGRLQIDPLLGLLSTAALFLATREAATSSERRRDLLFAGLLTGLGALAKGPVAWFLVGLPLLMWRWILPRPPVRVSRSIVAASCALSIVPVLAWALAVVAVEPKLAFDLFFRQHVQRATAGTDHVNPPWYFAEYLPALMLPWTLPVLAGFALAWRSWRARRASEPLETGLVLAASWLGILFVFFSAITGKRDLYLLPAMPAAALLASRWFSVAVQRGRASPWIAAPGPALLALLGAAICAAGFVQSRLPDDVPPIGWRGAAIGLPLLAGAMLALVLLKRRRIAASVRATAWALGAAALAAALTLFPEINPLKSARSIALVVAARPEQPSHIPCVGEWPEGFRFYSERPFVHGTVGDAPFGDAPEREGVQFLGLIQDRNFDVLPPTERARYRIVHAQRIGRRTLYVVGAAGAAPPSVPPK